MVCVMRQCVKLCVGDVRQGNVRQRRLFVFDVQSGSVPFHRRIVRSESVDVSKFVDLIENKNYDFLFLSDLLIIKWIRHYFRDVSKSFLDLKQIIFT